MKACPPNFKVAFLHASALLTVGRISIVSEDDLPLIHPSPVRTKSAARGNEGPARAGVAAGSSRCGISNPVDAEEAHRVSESCSARRTRGSFLRTRLKH